MLTLLLDTLVALSCLFLTVYFYFIRIKVPKGLRLPPGPPRHPIWGNLKDIPSSGVLEYRVYEKLAKEYGDLVYLNVLGRSILLVNSPEMERELFGKRGAVYSDRHTTVMMHDLTTFGDSTVITMEYGEKWSRHRAIIHDLIAAKKLDSFQPLLERVSRSLAQRLTSEPINDLGRVRYAMGEFTLRFVYGIDILPDNDPYVELAERTLKNLTRVLAAPGEFQVDIFPFLKYLPSWFPGLEFPAVAKRFNDDFQDMLDRPYNYAKQAFNQGSFNTSFVSQYLENSADDSTKASIDEELIRQVAVALFIAGTDGVDCQVRLFFLAMALHPEAQKKAQEELDMVVGRDTLPSFSDLPNLPYLIALCNEVIRWHPVTPWAIPHRLMRDDVINGYFIPKGTTVIGNTWTINRSQKDYGPDSHKFRPERFLEGNVRLPDAAFGYGRRICPGKALGENLLFIMAATVLHVANISPLKDDPLIQIVQNHEFTPGVIARPRDYHCRIDVRHDIEGVLNQFVSH